MSRVPPGIIATALGFAMAAGGLWWKGTPAGAMLWAYAVIFSFLGYGHVTARWIGVEVSIGFMAVLGFAVLLVSSTLLAHLGVLTPTVQTFAVIIGIACCAPATIAAPAPRGWIVAFVIVASVVLLGMRVVDVVPWIVDGVNQTMEVKRLWDTGAVTAIPHQAGLQTVGAAYVALGGEAGTAAMFDPGLCATLVVLVLATELASKDDDFAVPMFLLLAVPIVLMPEPTTMAVSRWGGALLHLALFFALQRVMVARRALGLVVIIAVALVALRWQFVIVAAPYVIAAVLFGSDRSRSRRAIVISLVCWIGLLTLAGSGFRGSVGALGVALAVGALTAVTLPLLGTHTWRSPLGVLVFALLSSAIAPALGVVPKTANSPSALSAVWLGGMFALFTLIDSGTISGRVAARIRVLPAALIVGVMIAATTLWPNFQQHRRDHLRNKMLEAIARLQFAHNNGYETGQSERARVLQDQVPPGARIGVWGVSWGHLDYTRNPIRDLSLRSTRHFLRPLLRSQLLDVEFLIVEDIELPPDPQRRLPWGYVRVPPTRDVQQALELTFTSGTTTLYRVRPS